MQTPIIVRLIRTTRGDYSHPGQCGYCGSHACNSQPVTCTACGATVCHGWGLGNGHCPICYVGYLPGWSTGNRPAICQRSGCSAPAVATFHKRELCATHAAGHITPNLAGWESWPKPTPTV